MILKTYYKHAIFLYFKVAILRYAVFGTSSSDHVLLGQAWASLTLARVLKIFVHSIVSWNSNTCQISVICAMVLLMVSNTSQTLVNHSLIMLSCSYLKDVGTRETFQRLRIRDKVPENILSCLVVQHVDSCWAHYRFQARTWGLHIIPLLLHCTIVYMPCLAILKITHTVVPHVVSWSSHSCCELI